MLDRTVDPCPEKGIVNRAVEPGDVDAVEDVVDAVRARLTVRVDPTIAPPVDLPHGQYGTRSIEHPRGRPDGLTSNDSPLGEPGG